MWQEINVYTITPLSFTEMSVYLLLSTCPDLGIWQTEVEYTDQCKSVSGLGFEAQVQNVTDEMLAVNETMRN